MGLSLDTCALLRRLIHSRTHLGPQFGTDDFQKVVRGLAACELQVPSGPFRQMRYLVIFGDDDGRWRIGLDQPLMHLRRRQSRARSLWDCAFSAHGPVDEGR